MFARPCHTLPAQCKYDKFGSDDLKMCPVCGAFVPPLAAQLEDRDEEAEQAEADSYAAK